MAPKAVYLPLSLHHEPHARNLIFHQVDKKSPKTPSIDIDLFLGNHNGEPQWGGEKITHSASHDPYELKGGILVTKLATYGNKEWKLHNINLGERIRFNGKELEYYKPVTLDPVELEKHRADNEKLFAQIAKENEREAAAVESAKKSDEIEKKAKESAADTKADLAKTVAEDKINDAKLAAAAEAQHERDLEVERKLREAAAAAKKLNDQKEATLEAELAAVKTETAYKRGSHDVQAEKKEAQSEDTQQDLREIEEQIKLTNIKLTQEANTIRLREQTVAEALGGGMWLNGEMRERDEKMVALAREEAELYRTLSLSHQRYSTLDSERIALSEKHHRIRADYAELMESFDKTTAKLSRVTLEASKQKAELEHELEETARFERRQAALELELAALRTENAGLTVLTTDLKKQRTDIRFAFENTQKTITKNESVIRHFGMWKVIYEQQIQALRKELAELALVKTRIEQGCQDTTKSFEVAEREKAKIQSDIAEVKYSKTAVEGRVRIVEDALKSSRTELSRLTTAFDRKDDELRALASARAVLERQVADLSNTHLHERDVSRELSERLVQVQGNLVENVDWMYEMRDGLGEGSKYLYLHYLQNGGEIGLGLQSPSLSRLPSYRSAVNSPAGSPSRGTVAPLKEVIEYSAAAPEVAPADVKIAVVEEATPAAPLAVASA